jgi:nucleotide-binding universal stress UspA family protein
MAGRAQTIVVGYDGSEGARRALDRAADLVGYGTDLAVVSVTATSGHPDGRQPLDEARTRLHARQLAARSIERAGDPAAELVAAARTLNADLLIVGAGQNGSVRTQLAREAPCDVLLVR